MDNRTQILEELIRSKIVIPQKISINMWTETTGLGGVFLCFASNTAGRLGIMNSKARIRFEFVTEYGYIGPVCGLDVTSTGIKGPRNIKNPIHYTKVVDKVNKWLSDNADLLYSTIENK